MGKRKWKPKNDIYSLEAILVEVSDQYLTLEELNVLAEKNYENDEVLLDVLRKHCRPAFDCEPESGRKLIQNALAESLTDPNYQYDEIWCNLVFPFAYPTGIQDPKKFLGILWEAIFDRRFSGL